jgi:hypothetical protein
MKKFPGFAEGHADTSRNVSGLTVQRITSVYLK